MLYSEYEDDEVTWLQNAPMYSAPEADVWGLIGPSNVGKRLFTADLAARISQGWPAAPIDPLDPTRDRTDDPTPGFVIMIHPEDKAFVMKASLVAAGANTELVDNMTFPDAGGDGGTFIIQRDLPLLKKRVKELGDCRGVFIDPLMATTNRTIAGNLQFRMHTANPLQQWAEDTGISVCLVHHFNKFPKMDNLEDSINGSAAFVQALRVTNVIMPGTPDPEVKVFSNLNNNIGPKKINFAEYKIYEDGMNTRLRWKLPPLEVTGNNYEALETHILAMLVGARRPVTSQEISTYTELSHGIVKQLLARARREGKLEKTRGGGFIPTPAIEAAATRELTY